MKASEITLPVFTDYSKVCDTIDISILIKKMHRLNFSKRFLYWIFSYLTERRHFVQIDALFSNTLYINLACHKDLFLDSFFLTYALLI